jgi:DNA-binding GntR family transcriptional regulator
MPAASAKPPKGLAIVIADKIRTAIVDAELEFGESLSEDTLASAFEVSRTPVREALNILQIEGLVTIVPKSGTYVFTPTVEDITELCDYRIGLEQHAVTLTPRDSIGKAAAELQKQLDAMEGAIAASDMQAYGRADTEFHLAFFRHCGNRYLRNAYHLILGRVASLRTHLAINAPGEPDRSMADHRQMLALLAQGKKAEIAALLGKHIAHTRNNYLEVFQVNDPVGRARGRAIRLRRRLAILA